MRFEQLLTEGGIAVFANAAQKLSHPQHHCRETHLAEAETGHCTQQFHELARRQVATLDLFFDKRESRVTRYHGAIEIEERSDLGPIGQIQDFGDNILVR
jgi:hypothetical protein